MKVFTHLYFNICISIKIFTIFKIKFYIVVLINVDYFEIIITLCIEIYTLKTTLLSRKWTLFFSLIITNNDGGDMSINWSFNNRFEKHNKKIIIGEKDFRYNWLHTEHKFFTITADAWAISLFLKELWLRKIYFTINFKDRINMELFHPFCYVFTVEWICGKSGQ